MTGGQHSGSPETGHDPVVLKMLEEAEKEERRLNGYLSCDPSTRAAHAVSTADLSDRLSQLSAARKVSKQISDQKRQIILHEIRAIYKPLLKVEIEEIRVCQDLVPGRTENGARLGDSFRRTRERMIKSRQQLYNRRVEMELQRILADKFSVQEALKRIGCNVSNASVLMHDWNMPAHVHPQGLGLSLASEKREATTSHALVLGASVNGLASTASRSHALGASVNLAATSDSGLASVANRERVGARPRV